MGFWHKTVWQHIDEVVDNPAIRAMLQRWNMQHDSLRDGARPPLAAFATERDTALGRSLMLLEPVGDDFAYRHYGAGISEVSGFDMNGRRVGEFGGELGAFFLAHYREVRQRGEPAYTVHYSNRARSVLSWERLILPVCDESGADWLAVFNFPLESRQQLIESVLNASNDAVLALRVTEGDVGADALVLVANPRSVELLGLAGSDHVGRPVGEVLPQWAELGLDRHCGDALERRTPVAFECQAVGLDGQLRRLAVQAAPMRDGVTLRFTDVTDLRAIEARLRESEKLNAIGTLARGVAHDFNNLLAAILGHVVLARDELAPSHPVHAHLEQIDASARRGRSLVHQILAFSRSQKPAFAVLPLKALVDEALPLLATSLPAGAELDVACTNASLHVRGDAPQLHQVLMNLVVNAAQALGGHAGRITIGIDENRSDHHADVPGRWAHLWVRDTGCGMDEATRARIFEPFFTTKPVGQGTGLGLSVVHGIAGAHGATIDVDSTPGAGSTFHLWLPAVAAPKPVPLDIVGARDRPVPGRGEHLLLVDDDEVVALVTARLLERAGYRVSVYHDGALALAALRDAPRAFDLVLTDLNMPGLSGLAVARALAAIRGDLPVIIASGFIDDALRGEAARAGVGALLHKEHLTDALLPQVQRVLADARAR